MQKVKLKTAVTLGRNQRYLPGETIEVSKEIAKYLKDSGCIESKNNSVPLEPLTNPFTEIEVVDDKTAGYLIKKGITNIEQLANTDLKTLEDIYGVSKNKAKEIYESFDSESFEEGLGNEEEQSGN